MAAIVRVESGFNPLAIGVVGDALVRQPNRLAEAVSTTRALVRDGLNFSIGIAQINRVHFARLGWEPDGQAGFEPCENLRAAAGIFGRCHTGAMERGYPDTHTSIDNARDTLVRIDATTPATAPPGTYTATHAALSCYYSGDFIRGAELGYVDRVLGGRANPPSKSTRAGAPRAPLPMMLITHDDN